MARGQAFRTRHGCADRLRAVIRRVPLAPRDRHGQVAGWLRRPARVHAWTRVAFRLALACRRFGKRLRRCGPVLRRRAFGPTASTVVGDGCAALRRRCVVHPGVRRALDDVDGRRRAGCMRGHHARRARGKDREGLRHQPPRPSIPAARQGRGFAPCRAIFATAGVEEPHRASVGPRSCRQALHRAGAACRQSDEPLRAYSAQNDRMLTIVMRGRYALLARQRDSWSTAACTNVIAAAHAR